MEEKLEMLKDYWLVPYCKGAAIGGTNAVITMSYDHLIRSLPLWVRIPMDVTVSIGCHLIGMELLQLLETATEKE